MDIDKLIKDYKAYLKKNTNSRNLNIFEIGLLLSLIISGALLIIFSLFRLLIPLAVCYIWILLSVVVLIIYIKLYEKHHVYEYKKAKIKTKNTQIMAVLDSLKKQSINVKSIKDLSIVYLELRFRTQEKRGSYTIFGECMKTIVLPSMISLIGIIAVNDGSQGVLTAATTIVICVFIAFVAFLIAPLVNEILLKKNILIIQISGIIAKIIIDHNSDKCKIKRVRHKNDIVKMVEDKGLHNFRIYNSHRRKHD